VIGRLRGCAAPIGVQTQAYNRRYQFWGTEQFAPGSFDAVRPGIVALKINHADYVPARFQMIRSEARRLMFRVEVYDSPGGHDVMFLARAGKINGCSVGIHSLTARYGDRMVHEILRAELAEISLITGSQQPAYADTWCEVER
jgi:phage head maturation protease